MTGSGEPWRTDAVVLIDGPSGAGKSTFARRLAHEWPGHDRPVLLRMDDVYPGWNGLDAASEHVHDHVLVPRAMSHSARWRRYDWVAEQSAEWHEVPADRPLIIEGCGSLTRRNFALATLRIWIDADGDLRRHRALTRDRGGFDDHWDMWSRQFEAFERRERPLDHADVVIRNDHDEAGAWLDAALSRS